MEKEYYYLDKKEQKGPCTIEQLKTVGLKSDTLVWTEDFDNWKPVSEVNELKILLKKTPPPPPVIDTNPSSSNEIKKETQEEIKVLVDDSNVKFWASFKIYTFSFFLIGCAILGAFFISNSKKHELRNEIDNRINNILEGKTVVLDGTFSLTQGELEETGYNSKDKKVEKKWFKIGKDSILLDNSFIQNWWEREKLYAIYKASNGGFTIKMLTKRYPDGYDIETITSGDMGYKNPKRRYISPQYIDGYYGKTKISDGYYLDNYRLPVRQCYTQAYEFFTKEDRQSPGAYSPGKYVDISNFPDIRNNYYYMANREPIQYTSSGQFSSYWYSTDEHGANINTEDWVVYHTLSGRHYVLSENKESINKDLITYLAVSSGSIFLILMIVGLSKPKYFRNLNLFGKRWKNISYHDQIFFFEHSFFDKHSFTEITNDKISKGILKFTDKGNTLNLSYPNKELFYKIDKIDKDSLSLTSMKDKSEITFIRVGAEGKKQEQEEIITNNEVVKNEETNQ